MFQHSGDDFLVNLFSIILSRMTFFSEEINIEKLVVKMYLCLLTLYERSHIWVIPSQLDKNKMTPMVTDLCDYFLQLTSTNNKKIFHTMLIL
jgi:hypothetical protein